VNRSLFHIHVALALMLPGLLHAQLTFDPANPPSSANPPTELYHEYTGTYSHQKGPKTVMVFLVQPSDGATWTSPPSFATLDGQLNTGSANYYNLYSYKQAWFGPKRRSGMDIPRLIVTPVLQLPGTTQAYKDNGFGQLQSDCLAAARALGGDYAEGQIKDYNNYDRWVVMSNTKLITSTGLAYVGGRFAWTDGSLSGGVAEHEWGHNWGVYHANAWNVPAGAPPRSPAGSSEEYGDGWDLMGGNIVSAGFNVLFRHDLGFLERSRNEVVDATTSGTYRLYDYIHPDRRQATALARGLLIPMSSFTDPKRIFLGFGHTTGISDSRTVWNRNALTMHTVLGSTGSSRIDTTPGSRQTGDATDSAIKIGRTYSEGPNINGTQVNGGFHITPTARGAATVNGQTHEWMDVVVNYQNDIIGNHLPVASFASNPYGIAPGAPLTFSVTASDPNGDALAYDWDFGDGTLSTINNASQTKTWFAAGFYLVSCTVSDMKGGVVTASTWINVGSESLRPADTPAATVAGIDFERFSGAWTTLPNFSQIPPVATGTVSTISLPPGAPANNYAVRYSGYLNIPATNVYQFSLTSKDGSRLQIGGTTVIDNDGQRSAALTQSGNAYLSAGAHAFTVEFFNRDNTASINLKWRTATTALTTLVAADFLRTDRTGNDIPVVSMLSPAENAELVAGSSVLLQASAIDADGIAKVQYYAGDAYLGESSIAPFEVTWSNLSPGIRQVQAYAIDSTGRTALSSARTFSVVSPEPRNLISINFAGDSSASMTNAGVMLTGDSAGAVYSSNQWTTLRATAGFGNPFTFQQMNATTTGLRDQTGSATTASITTVFTASNVLSNTSPANTGNSRLMRSYAWKRNDGDPGTITVNDLPYVSYDVYVYFDALNTDANDIVPFAFTLNGVTKYGQNAVSLVAGKGDFPNYETWVEYREATASSASAPIADRLGNYVVFRDQTDASFTLTVGASDPVNGIQIVETVTHPFISVTPANPTIYGGATRQFTAVTKDASGVPLDPQPAVTWSVSGGGTINSSGLLTAGHVPGSFTVTASASGVTGSTGFTIQQAPGVSEFSAFFNNGTGSTTDKAASLYNWNGAIGTSGTLFTTLANVAVSQGVTTSGTNGGVPLVTGSTSASFLFALPATSAGVSMLFTESLVTSATQQDSPQANWFRVGADSLSTLTVGDITQLSVYTRPATTATKMRFALRVGGNWLVSTTAFNQSNVNVYEPRVLTNLTAADAWYSGVFTPGSSLDADVANNPTVTLSASDAVTGYGWYADTDAQSASNSRVRIDSYVVSANVLPPAPTGYAGWAASAFPESATEAERAAGFDFEHDGHVNLLEYALGTDPAAASVPPMAQLVEIDGNEYLQIQWTRPAGRNDITTNGEVSPDLTPDAWTSGPADVNVSIIPAGPGEETVTIRDLSPLNGQIRRFLRARISLTP
jgi:hypothetical protein